ncbi:MAG: hypothetical protein ACKOMX_05215 [Actinomycetota bacterium]
MLRRTVVKATRIATVLALASALLLGPVAIAHATTVADDAKSLRNSVGSLTQDYERDYGSRVTPTERAELTTMAAQARREMNGLVGAIRKAERTDKGSDWRTARDLHSSALAMAQTRFDRAATLLRPRLSIREQLAAYSDYTRTLQEFERLGQRLPAGR